MRVMQILNDNQRGGVLILAEMIEQDLGKHGTTFTTAYLFPGPGISVWQKLVCAAAMVRRIWRGDFDALVAYQATSSILAGAVGWLRGCRLRIVHQTCTPDETAAPI